MLKVAKRLQRKRGIMKANFTEKLIRELKPDETKNWFEITDAKCSYLHCRIGRTGCKSYMLVKKIDGRCVRITIGKASEISVDFARKKAFELLEKIRNGINPNNEKQQLCKETTFGELFEEYMERHANRHSSPGHIKNTLNINKRRFARWKNKKISSLTMREIEQWFYAVRDSSGVFAANQALTLLRHIYNKAIQWGWEGRNPTAGIKKFHVEARDRFLAPYEIQRLFSALDEEPDPVYRTFFYTLMFTGQRRGNVLSMRWEDIDFTTDVWFIPKTKNGTSLRVPLVGQLVLMLKELKLQSGGNPWVFPRSLNPKEHLTEPRKVWDRIKERARLSNLRMHDLRRTVASYECMGGVNLSVVSKTLNHKTLSATQVYARVDTSAVAQALQSTVNTFESFRNYGKS